MKDIVSKMLSGKFWITIFAGITFVYMSCNGMIAESAVVAIIVKVYSDYFGRK